MYNLDRGGALLNYIGSTVTSTSPKVGESAPTGSVFPMEWTAVSRASSFNLSYSLDNEVTWKNIPATIAGTDTFYDWIPFHDKHEDQVQSEAFG